MPLGFRPSGVLTAGMSLPRTQYAKPEQWIGFYASLVERLQSEPGVEIAAASLPLPLAGAGLNFGFSIDGRAAEGEGASNRTANYTAATPGYFALLGVPLLAGRTFALRDGAASPRVCVISSAFARAASTTACAALRVTLSATISSFVPCSSETGSSESEPRVSRRS